MFCLSEEDLGWTRVLSVVPAFRQCINLALFTFDLCVLFGLLCSQNVSNRNVGIGEPQRNADFSIVTFYGLRFTLYTTSLTFNNSTFCPHREIMCFVWISEQTAIISLYNIN